MLSAEVFEKTYRSEDRPVVSSKQLSPAAGKIKPSPQSVPKKSSAKKCTMNNDDDNGRHCAHTKQSPGVRSIPSGRVAQHIQRFTKSTSSSPNGGGGALYALAPTTPNFSPDSAIGRANRSRPVESPKGYATTTPSSRSRRQGRDRLSPAATATTPDNHNHGKTNGAAATTAAVTSADGSTPSDGLAGFAMLVSNAYKRECTTTTSNTTSTQNNDPAAAAHPATYEAAFVATEAPGNPTKEPRSHERTPKPPPPPPRSRPPPKDSPEKHSHSQRRQGLPPKRSTPTAASPKRPNGIHGGTHQSNPPHQHRENPTRGLTAASLDRYYPSPKGVIEAETELFGLPEPQSKTKTKIADAIMGFTPIQYDQIQKGIGEDPKQITGDNKNSPLNGVVSKLDAQFSTLKTIEDRSQIQQQQEEEQDYSIDSFWLDHYYGTAVANNHILTPPTASVQNDENISRSQLYQDWAAITDSDNDVDSMTPNVPGKRPTTTNASITLSTREQLEESKQVIRMLFRDLKVSKKQESDLKAKLQKSRLALQKHQSRYEENMRIAIRSADDVRANLQKLQHQRAKERAKSAAEIAHVHDELIEARQECLRWKLRALEQHPQEPMPVVEEATMYREAQSEQDHRQQPGRFRDLDSTASSSSEMIEKDIGDSKARLPTSNHGVHSPRRQEGYATDFQELEPTSPKLAAPQPPNEGMHSTQTIQHEEHAQQQKLYSSFERTTTEEDITTTTSYVVAEAAVPNTTATVASSDETTADNISFPKSSSGDDVTEERREIRALRKKTDDVDNFGVASNGNGQEYIGSGGNTARKTNLEYDIRRSEISVGFSQQRIGLEFVSSHSKEIRAVSSDSDDDDDHDNRNGNDNNDHESPPAGMLGGCGAGIQFGTCDSNPITSSAPVPEASAATTRDETKTNRIGEVGNKTRRATLNDLLLQLEASKKRLQLADQKWNGLVDKGGETLNGVISARPTSEKKSAEEESPRRKALDQLSLSNIRIEKSLQDNSDTNGESKCDDDDESDNSQTGVYVDGSIDVVDSLDDSIEVTQHSYAYV